VPVREIDGRIKRLYSIFLKLKRQKIELEQVTTWSRSASSPIQ
jgi:(p)ppGpp synthase/HD superfamily hydrolase